MKNLTIFLCFLVLQAQAQTKEETISWINNYGLDMMEVAKNGINVLSVDEDGNLTYDRHQIGTDSHKMIQNYFNVKDLYIPLLVIQDGELFKIVTRTVGRKIRIYDGTFISEGFITCGKDKTKAERLAKAIAHLAKLMGAKEKVDENKF